MQTISNSKKHGVAHPYPGMLLLLEAFDGGGKETQEKLLVDKLIQQGHHVQVFREPGATVGGEDIRTMLLEKRDEYNWDWFSQACLFFASRRQNTIQNIIPALKQGNIVIVKRYALSTLIYQGYGMGGDLSLIDNMNEIACDGMVPDRTFVLTTTFKEALRRADPVSTPTDNKEVQHHIWNAYQKAHIIAKKHSLGDVVMVDAMKSIEKVHATIWKSTQSLLSQKFLYNDKDSKIEEHSSA